MNAAISVSDACPTSLARKRRLCIVMGGHWAAQMGGAQFQAKCLLDAIGKREGLEVYYLANRVRADFEPETYRIVRVGSNWFARARLLAHLPSLYAALKRLRPDVIYQRSLTPYTAVCAYYARRHGARFVFHIASDVDARRVGFRGWRLDTLVLRISRRIAEYGLRHASAIVAQTHDQARSLAAEYGVSVDAVVPNFHPAPDASDGAARREGLRVIWVANFKAVKRPECFVKLAEAFRERRDVEFVMIGRPGGAAHYGRLRDRMAALPNLRYLGELPLESTEREIAASDVLVNTSSYEGFPNTFIQAWLRGLPVLSLEVDPDGCLSRGGAGIRAGGEEELRRILWDILSDRDRLQRMGEAAQDYARRHHGFEQAERLIDAILQAREDEPGGHSAAARIVD